MSRSKRSRGRKTYRSLAVERLEDRALMAGDLAAVLSGNTLTLTGDAADNQIKITQISATKLRVDGGATTTINGAAGFQDFNAVGGNLKIKMQGGADSLILGDGVLQLDLNTLSIDMGAASDNLVVERVHVAGLGTTAITMGTNAQVDPDSLTLKNSMQFAGGLNITTGGGSDGVSLAFVTVGKDLLIDEGTGVSPDSASLGGLTIVGSLTLKQGDGSDGASFMSVTVGKDLSLDQGGDASPDSASLTTLMVAGVITVKQGNGSDGFSFTSGSIGKAFSLDQGADVSPDSSSFSSVTVLGNFALHQGNGSDGCSLTSVGVGGNLFIDQGADLSPDSLSATTLTVLANFNLLQGSGSDGFSFNGASVGQNLTVDQGAEASPDGGSLTTVTVLGALSIKQGNGSDSCSFMTVSVSGNLLLDQGVDGGNDGASLSSMNVFGALTIKQGDGDDGLSLNSIGIAKAASIDVGKGNDGVTFTTVIGGGKIDVKLGDGANGFSANSVTASLGFHLFGGKDVDSVSVNTLRTPSASFTLFAGSDSLSIASLAKNPALDRANLAVDLGTGDDGASIVNSFLDQASFKLGDGVNTLSANMIAGNKFSVFGGAGVETFNLFNSTILELAGTFAASDDVVTLNTVTITNKVSLNGGAGTNHLNTAAVSYPANKSIVNFV